MCVLVSWYPYIEGLKGYLIIDKQADRGLIKIEKTVGSTTKFLQIIENRKNTWIVCTVS